MTFKMGDRVKIVYQRKPDDSYFRGYNIGDICEVLSEIPGFEKEHGGLFLVQKQGAYDTRMFGEELSSVFCKYTCCNGEKKDCELREEP
jgi:hypothetical protein